MGHYYTNLACSKCGDLRCTCETASNEEWVNQWVVGSEFKVVRASEFQRENNQQGLGFMRRMSLKHFAKKSDAMAHAKTELEAAIAAAEARVVTLKLRRSAVGT